jgi:hypothetical protein
MRGRIEGFCLSTDGERMVRSRPMAKSPTGADAFGELTSLRTGVKDALTRFERLTLRHLSWRHRLQRPTTAGGHSPPKKPTDGFSASGG